ncbi:MAG: ComF family protein [Betaproteobacteria bacterium]|nr:ComF family protein [Betaproteobacteria bacterium]
MTGWLFELWRPLRRPPSIPQPLRGRWSARRLPAPSQEAIWLYSGGSYTDEVVRQIRLAKYARHWPSVLALRARLIDSRQSGLWGMRPVLIPMPSDPQRLCERGFHLPVEMAKHLARLTACPLDRTALIKRQHSPEQASLGRQERLANLSNHFQAAARLGGQLVVLVDDVMTTGASLTAAQQALLAVGARVVAGLVLADARPDSSMIKGVAGQESFGRVHKPSQKRPKPRPKLTAHQTTDHDPESAHPR